MNATIPFSGVGALAGKARTTRVVAVLLVLSAVAAIAVAALSVARPRPTSTAFLPSGTDGIVVLDLSASISSDTYQRIGTTLRELAGTGGRYGLVAFSDVAYRALPPGTPARALGGFARFFTLPRAQSGFLPQFPANPWTNTFSAGTRISAGLGLALQTIRREHLGRPGVVLVSDLDDDPGDLENLASVALAYRQLRIPIRIVALNAAVSDERLFSRLLGSAAKISHARLPGERAPSHAPFAWLAAFAVLALAAVLAFGELWRSELTWGAA